MIKKFFKYTLFLLPLLFPILVHADTTIDTSTWINVTGVKWSQTGLFYTSNPTFNNDWLLNNYYVYSGTFIGSEWNYIEFSYFENSTGTFNPCNSTSKFTANFSLLFTSPGIVDQVWQVKWGNDNCAMTSKNSQTGIIDLSCSASPSTGSQTDIFVYYSDSIFQQNQSYVYISRDIDIACTLNTDAIINNDNANTQNIINSQNQNTQDIINNQNQNTQDLIDSNKVCYSKKIDSSYKEYNNSTLNSSGNVASGYTNWSVSEYIEFDTLELIDNWSNSTAHTCFYDSTKTLISCSANSSLSVGIINVSGAKYFRTTFLNSIDKPIFKITTCKNGNQALDDSINSLDSTLNDDDTSGATSEASDFFSDFNTNTFGLTSIITAPLSLIQSLLSSSCSYLQLPLPYLNNKYLTLPCMSNIYSTYFGNFFTLYQTITYGIVAYWVCVRIFNLVKDFKNPEHDEIEVLDL